MLAGTVYYYDKDDKLIEKMDLYDYEDMSQKEFLEYVQKIGAYRVTIGSVSNNHQQVQHIEEVYKKQWELQWQRVSLSFSNKSLTLFILVKI